MKQSKKYLRENKPRFGTIMLNDGSSIVHCTVRNYSSKGGLLKLHEQIQLGSDFELAVEGETDKLFCKVVWRQGDLLGVLFKSDWSAIGCTSGDLADRKSLSKKSN